jgi:phage terminase Nu1 subunit (DNA packaging protein)
MSLESLHWYAEKTGKARETIVKYFNKAGLAATDGPKQAKLYETATAFPIIYSSGKSIVDQNELDRARTENLEADTALKRIKEQQLLGELAPINVLEWALASVCAQIGAILETLPAKLKRRLPQLNAADLEIIRKEIAKTRNVAAAVRLDLADPDESANQQVHRQGDDHVAPATPAKTE